MKRKAELKKAFRSAKTSGEMLKEFKKMEPFFDESELGMEFWAIAREFLSDGVPLKKQNLLLGSGILEKVLFYGKKALKALLDNDKHDYYTKLPCIKSKFTNFAIQENVDNHGSSLFVASTCCLLGAACSDLGRHDEGLAYLNWANRNISKLDEDEGDNRCGGNCVLHVLDLTQQELCNIKRQMGRKDEVFPHIRKVVEIRESIMKEGCLELGKVYYDACLSYMDVGDTNQASPFCLKALEVFTKNVGSDSVEVGSLRRHLAIIYYDSDETEKAIEQNQLALGILKKHTPNSQHLVGLEIENAHMLLALDRRQEATEVLKGLVSRDDIGKRHRVISFVTLGKVLCKLGNFADAKKYMRAAQKILEKKCKELETFLVASLFGDISDHYKNMNDFETAISFSKRALSLPDIPERSIAENSSRIFLLVSLFGKEKEELTYMKDAVEKLKEKFGPMHREVGYSYISLGAAYLKSGQSKLAVKFMAMAKDIMDATAGHLSLFCSIEERHSRVIRILEKVVKGCGGKQEFLDDAIEILNNLKEGVAESPTVASTQSIEDVCSTQSECGISGVMEETASSSQ